MSILNVNEVSFESINFSILQESVDSGILVDQRTPTPLETSPRAGQRRLRTEVQPLAANIQRLLASGENQELVDILMKYSKNTRSYSVLEEAVFQKDYRAVDVLLANGYPLNAPQMMGRTAATIAVLNDDEKMIDYLLKKGAIFTSDNLGYIARFDVDYKPRYDKAIQRLELLKSKGVNIKISQETLRTILPQVSLELIDLFLKNGTDVKGEPFKAPGPSYPLGIMYYAVQRGDISIIKLLIDRGASLDSGAYSIQTLYNPLTMAIYSNRIDIATMLLENGAYVPEVICNGITSNNGALIKYAFEHKFYDLVTLLLKKVHTKNIPTPYKEDTLLQRAIAAKDVRMVRALLEGGIDPNNRGSQPISPLKMALGLENQEIVELLIKYKAKLDDV